MSIINEALKKAQKEKESMLSFVGGAHTQMRLHKKHGFNWGPIFVLLVLFLITGPILAPYFAAPFKKEAVMRSSVPATVSVGQNFPVGALTGPAHKGQFGIEETPLLPTTPLPAGVSPSTAFRRNFSLSGIVYSPKESYCIINDRIVKVGEFVSGAKLLSITPEKVVLEYQGQTIQLV